MGTHLSNADVELVMLVTLCQVIQRSVKGRSVFKSATSVLCSEALCEHTHAYVQVQELAAEGLTHFFDNLIPGKAEMWRPCAGEAAGGRSVEPPVWRLWELIPFWKPSVRAVVSHQLASQAQTPNSCQVCKVSAAGRLDASESPREVCVSDETKSKHWQACLLICITSLTRYEPG